MIDCQTAGLTRHGLKDGKLGLALSGGGFRAALFHIGVFARLAQRDLLRHVAVISTVSGGSIIGAFYYLKVKQLLEGKRPDKLKPTSQAYCQLIQEIEVEFLLAIQNNMRLMTFADHRENARMLTGESSPTRRVAQLLDQYFYAPITGSTTNLLCDLPIHPLPEMLTGHADSAEPTTPVPQLILNATALNTGHLFQFTGTHIGEPSISSVSGGTSTMPRLEQLRFDDSGLTATQRERLDQITLGQAVAASCCVPGLLEPLCLSDLYQDDQGEEVSVRLVDGGVFDNQGLVSLFEEQCTHYVCSDASDLLQWQSSPEKVFHAAAMRANDIFMDRIRIGVMQELLRREKGRVAVFSLGGMEGSDVFGNDANRFLRSLRSIRTDLDAFSDIEAWSLMYHGYMISDHHLLTGEQEDEMPDSEAAQSPASSTDQDKQPADWQFAAIRELAKDNHERDRILRHLTVGSRQLFKVFYLGESLPWLIVVLPSLIPVGLSVLLIYLLPPIPTAAWVVLGLIILSAVAFTQNARIIGWLDQIETIKRFRKKLMTSLKPLGITVIMGLIGALASWINLKIFCPLFLRYGQLVKRK